MPNPYFIDFTIIDLLRIVRYFISIMGVRDPDNATLANSFLGEAIERVENEKAKLGTYDAVGDFVTDKD